MPDARANQYAPDYVTPPGATLDDTLRSLGMSQRDLALRTGRPVKTINEIIRGKAAITSETALQLERVLGISAGFWSNRERVYRESLARQKDEERLQSVVGWLKSMPVKELVSLGWITGYNDAVAQLRELLGFFGVTSPEHYDKVKEQLFAGARVAFRKSQAYKADSDAIMAWLRMGEMRARKIGCEPFDAGDFEQALIDIRSLTHTEPAVFQKELVQRCSECGVAVVFVRELSKTRTSGATRWLTPHKALIQLSLRYKSDDMLWFSFFHEAAHVLLHGKRSLFLEQRPEDPKVEAEANGFAQDILIPKSALSEFVREGNFSAAAMKAFADGIGIAPGLVVGRLQHDGHLPMTHLNKLKVRLRWKTEQG